MSLQTPTDSDTRVSGWVGWRLRLLILTVLLGCVVLFLLARWLASQPSLDASWRTGEQGQVVLAGSDLAALRPYRLQTLVGLTGAKSMEGMFDELALQRSARWLVDDTSRQRHREMHERLAEVFSQPSIGLKFADGSVVEVRLGPRGFGALGTSFWLLAGLALVLCLAACISLLARPSQRNVLYATMALCQVGNLVFAAIESTPALGLQQTLAAWDMPARMAFDLLTAAAAVHAASLYLAGNTVARHVVSGVWSAVSVLIALAATGHLDHAWWWTQAAVALLCLIAIALLSRASRSGPHPMAAQMRRVIALALAMWALLTLSLAVAEHLPRVQHLLAASVSTTWYVFLTSLLLVSLLARPQHIIREFSLLAAISVVATSLDLLFVDVSPLGPVASLTLTLFVSLAVYSVARQWILTQLLGSSLLTTEHLFEQLYRLAREAEAHPQRVPALLLQLLSDLFEPMQAQRVDDMPASAQLSENGTTLLVPVPALAGRPEASSGAIRIRFAQRGRRLFANEDVRLADRIIEQLQRAAAFDRGVEQGRREERLRLAQDLHDDIGARLLTMMYKAQSPEMEEYVRHTLKDLKTLTRGLAASDHHLSHAAAEWKADLTQRLTEAGVVLGWTLAFDRDILLGVVQWSALTRILRELVSNVITHAGASRVEIALSLEGDRLELSVRDDGSGSDPHGWSLGLGLGGVRKRIRQLGGEVEWLEAKPRGIDCRVRVPLQSAPG